MTRGSQDIKVNNINRELVTMASLVEKQIYESMLSLKNHDMELANKIINNDDKVDEMQKIIEEQCIKYIASEQPLATDLRKIMTASKDSNRFRKNGRSCSGYMQNNKKNRCKYKFI